NEQIISDKTTNYYYLTAEVSPEASYSRDLTEVNFSFRIDISTTYFLLDPEGINSISSRLVALQETIRTQTVRIEVSRDIVYVRPLVDIIARIPEKVYQSEREILLPLGISVGKRGLGVASADWSRLRVEKSTYASDFYTRFDRSSWTMVEVWHDENGNGFLDTGMDRKLGEAKFDNNSAIVIFSQPEKIDKQEYLAEYATYFVCCYIPKNAAPNEKLKLYLTTGTYLTLGGVDIVESNNFPIISPEITIADWPDEVETELYSLSPREAALYEQDVLVARVDLLAFCDATLDKLVITHEGTSEATSTVKVVKVYLDNGDLRFDKTKDVIVATGTFDTTGKCELIFFNPEGKLKYKPLLILDEKVRAFLTFDFNEDALPDKTIGVGVDPTGFTYNLPNRQKPFGYFSTSKIVLLDKRTPTKPVIIPSVPLEGGIDTGKEIENVIFYTPYSNELKFHWYSEAPFGGGIKTGYAGISLKKPVYINENPEILQYVPVKSVGDVLLSGLNLEHNKVYYLWIKAESNANFVRINYVPIFVDNTPAEVSPSPVVTIPSNGIYWINSNIKDDNESFIYSVEIEERVHQEYIWKPITEVKLRIPEIIKEIYFDRLPKVVRGTQIILSSRNVVSEDVVIEYNFVVSPSIKENTEVVSFKTLFSVLGYKIENSSIKLSYRITGREDNKMYYYRVKTKNVVKLTSVPSESSNAIYLSLPRKTIVELTTFPNPCDVRKKKLNISYVLSEDAEVNIKIFNLFGSLVYEKSFTYGDPNTKPGTHFVECDSAKDFPAGMYILLLETKNTKGIIDHKKWKLGIIR
ncbi:MAG: T9SS type A sorting domain-containing protein, partial [Endomicrobia bacterium]|nr:T9SS type A sorting domain-containing protein [Endomicrobiia bacterium]